MESPNVHYSPYTCVKAYRRMEVGRANMEGVSARGSIIIIPLKKENVGIAFEIKIK
jgi:hypothetical protein